MGSSLLLNMSGEKRQRKQYVNLNKTIVLVKYIADQVNG
ncbi:hypothetical protein EPIB1_1866 [Tritonibacter mobilis]|nr:hypothetical protein EPIB1_1866 [Tritonibacter mobilis]